MSKAQFQQKVNRSLAAADLSPDKIDSYGQMVTWKKRADELTQPAKLYAWQILELTQGEIYDYFNVVDDGVNYLVIRFIPDFLPDTTPRGWENGKAKPAAKPSPATPKAKPSAAKPSPATKPIISRPVPTLKVTVKKSTPKRRNGRLGSYKDNGGQAQVGQIAWTTILKKDGSTLKQARCEIKAVSGDQVDVQLTKTKRSMSVPVSNLFDHVPHCVNQVWQ